MNAAIIIDDREAIANKAISDHKKYLSDDWVVLNLKPPYIGGIYHIKTAHVYNNILTNANFWRSRVSFVFQTSPTRRVYR
jgi:hypothetical protein